MYKDQGSRVCVKHLGIPIEQGGSVVTTNFENAEQPKDNAPWQFSVRMLLVATFLVAVACALYPYVFLPGIIALTLLGFTGVSAYRSARMVPYAQAMTALFLTMLLPINVRMSRNFWMSDSDAIAYAIITGLGLYFSAKPIWKGNWPTKIFAFLIFLLFFGNAMDVVFLFIRAMF